jgi:hypothetical protein
MGCEVLPDEFVKTTKPSPLIVFREYLPGVSGVLECGTGDIISTKQPD